MKARMTRDELIKELERRGKSSTRAFIRAVPDRLLNEWWAFVLAELLRRRRDGISVPEPPPPLDVQDVPE